MPKTIEIPRRTWAGSLNEFTDMHEGWLVSVDVFGPEIGAQPEIDNLPLLAVSADRIDRDGAVAISVARSASDHLTHVIHDVRRILVEQADDGADVALDLESSDGTKTVLRFRAPARPEEVDGLVRP